MMCVNYIVKLQFIWGNFVTFLMSIEQSIELIYQGIIDNHFKLTALQGNLNMEFENE